MILQRIAGQLRRQDWMAYETMINTGALGIMRDADLVKQIQDYYARVDKTLHFEVGLEQNRDKLIDAERELGVSPVQEQVPAELAAIYARSPKLLATAQNYWLYTNRHLKLMRELRSEAERLAARLERS